MKYLSLILAQLLAFIVHAQNKQEIRNVEAFTKLYGYIRYFHPSDEAASLNWDKFAIYGISKVKNVTSDVELKKTLYELFKPIAPSIRIAKSPKFDIQTITPKDKNINKNIFWFHQGVGINNTGETYFSQRFNRKYTTEKESKGAQFFPISYDLDSKGLNGKFIKLVGKMKADVEDGSSGHFWLRVDKKNGMGFFNNMNNNPIVSNKWQNYSIEGKVDNDALNIYFGAFLAGKGKIWIDSIKIFKRSNNNENWSLLPVENADLKLKNAEGLPDKWFYNKKDNYSYSYYKDSIGPVIQIARVKPIDNSKIIDSIDYKNIPKPLSLYNAELVKGVNVIFPISVYGDASHTYPKGDSNAYNNLYNALIHVNVNNKTGDNLNVRFADIVITWNIFKHFFPYWQDASSDPISILHTAVVHAYNVKNSLDFEKTLMQLTASLNDGHIWVSYKGDTLNRWQLPISLTIVDDHIVVDKIFDSTFSDLQSGDVIEKINGIVAIQYLDRIMAEISGSKQWKQYRALNIFTNGAKQNPIVLKIDRMENPITMNRNMDSYTYYTRTKKAFKPSGEIKPGIFYLNLNTISKDTIDQWMPKLSTAKGIICDLRGYPNGNHNLINHLLTQKEDTKWMFIPKTTYPDQKNIEYLELGWNMDTTNPHINAKVIFLIDGRSISYAESYMGFIKDFKLATIIGQPTAGTNGDINPFNLPGGYTISWTGMMVKNHDGSKHHLLGILPDIYVNRSIDGIKQGKDEYLDKALDLLN
ncbi:S41 family peptidase [Rhizosphaericola mali]|uniref:Tail specific protease domain-containing protein n=1 Tax=Rhizosphaericola mali TaxID=2545455 RepID=A0A5P2GAU3_9BACT|nr:S41 family peptidase [Rhizosphaericola mali]QES90810.1 hypothetical protein E0W69_019890 [Rhizosphaericola mali]